MQEPDLYTYIGAAVIFASSIYIAIREARRSSAKREILAQTKAETRTGST